MEQETVKGKDRTRLNASKESLVDDLPKIKHDDSLENRARRAEARHWIYNRFIKLLGTSRTMMALIVHDCETIGAGLIDTSAPERYYFVTGRHVY